MDSNMKVLTCAVVAGGLWYLFFTLHLIGMPLPRLPRLRAPLWLRHRRAARVRAACANCEDCDVNIFILSPTAAMYECKTHGLIALYTDPVQVAAFAQQFGDCKDGL
jgi:hypothetical protein